MGYHRILVPLDGSTLAELALQHIPRLAAQGAQVHLVSAVVDTVGQMMALSQDLWPPSLSDELAARETYMNQVAGSLREKGFDVTVEVRAGHPVDLIAKRSNSFDLIVMATHGRTGLSRFLLGSISEGVLHEAACPVLIV